MKIEKLGINVEGDRIKEDTFVENEDVDICKSNINEDDSLITHNISHLLKVNLDVSAMLAYVSSVTNGSANKYDFSVKVLAQQAKWEQLRPQKPILDSFFEGQNIINTFDFTVLFKQFRRLFSKF